MGKFGLIILALIVLGLPAVRSSSPQADCLDTLMKLSSCMTFVMLGSNDTTPEGTCCDGLRNVLDTDASTGSQNGTDCLCDALSNGGSSYGVQVNRTKSMSLADACSVPATNCSSHVPRASAPAPVRALPLDTPPSRPASGTHSVVGIRAWGSTGSSVLVAVALIAAGLFI